MKIRGIISSGLDLDNVIHDLEQHSRNFSGRIPCVMPAYCNFQALLEKYAMKNNFIIVF